MRPEIITTRGFHSPLGAAYLGDGKCSFLVWAPNAKKVELELTATTNRVVAMQSQAGGYYSVILDKVHPGERYFFRLDDTLRRPDPASRFQPETVHGPSEVADPQFPWEDKDWKGLSLDQYIIYELHVGTATGEGTFEAIIPHLPELVNLGVSALELMPVSQFPGARNWGYDGVYPFAVQNTYGGPAGLKQLVNACHRHGLAIVLDVVYNHMGPEGNYLRDFGPYFTNKYKTPWGEALNFDDEHSHHVRRFFIENAIQWQEEFHIDALRLDAVHAIRDFSAVPFLQQLARATNLNGDRLARRFYLLAESDLNDPRLIRPEVLGGYGLDGQWSDDFHHVLHVLLTGERTGYYEDFGGTEQLAKCFRECYVHTGEYCRFRKRNHGATTEHTLPKQFVVYSQNHDQVGNRLLGERLSNLVTFEKLKLAAGAVLLSPFVPLLFMGEEYGEKAPFLYMVNHGDQSLLEAVRQGRRSEFASFIWAGEMPDPGAVSTFEQSKLHQGLAIKKGEHKMLREFYQELIRLRKAMLDIGNLERRNIQTMPLPRQNSLVMFYDILPQKLCVLFNFSDHSSRVSIEFAGAEHWEKLVDSAEKRWGGTGSSLPSLVDWAESRLKLSPNSVSVFAACA